MAACMSGKHSAVDEPLSLSASVFQSVPFSSNAPNTVLHSFTSNVDSATATMSTVTAHLALNRRTPPQPAKNMLAHGLLEAMRDLSPPRIRNQQNDLKPSSGDAADAEYMAWITKHPSAFDKFEEIIDAASGKRIAVFLDYDGTLSPIVEDPEQAFMSDEMRNTVKDIATLFPTAIITGRSREKVYEFVQLPELYYAGSHGMDIIGPMSGCKSLRTQGKRNQNKKGSNQMLLFQPDGDLILLMNEVFKLLEDEVKRVHGAKIEHNKFCISVHFRNVKEENWSVLAERVQHVLYSYPELCLTQGRKILEIRPSIPWNKGKALNYLLQALGSQNRNDFFPIYIGDDKTDEDAFKAVTNWKLGLGILVSNIAKETNAACSLRDTDEVLEFLRNLVQWRKSCLNGSLKPEKPF